MKLSYHHANPGAGNESFLLRYHSGRGSEGDTCILVDAGDDVNPSELLRPPDDLVAICLTHAHSDHYQSLGDCIRPETTVYASPPTASILDNVVELAARRNDVATLGEAPIKPIDSWTELVPGVGVHPVPAGHVPGAVGYLFRFEDDDKGETRHVLATGDFTRRRAAGYPGIESSLEAVDVLFLTVASRDDFRENTSDGLGQALQRARDGAKTLVTTSGLLGTQVTYLFSELAAEYQLPVPIRPVGQVAKLYEAMEYDCQYVEPVPVFDDPEQCLEHGTITIAGPESPTERSSGRLLKHLRDDPTGCVVQLHGTGTQPIDAGKSTFDAYETVNHPSRETIKAVHDGIEPVHTVVVHRHGGARNEFNHLDSCVWAPTDSDEYELFAEGWQLPPWMDGGRLTPKRASKNTLGAHVETDLIGDLSLSQFTRRDKVDLEAEGVDLDRIEAVLDQRTAYTESEELEQSQSDRDTPQPRPEVEGDVNDGPTKSRKLAENGVKSTSTGATSSAQNSTEDTMTDAESTDRTDESSANSSTPSQRPGEPILLDTLDSGIDGLDPHIEHAIESGEIDPVKLRALVEKLNQRDELLNDASQDTDAASHADSVVERSDDDDTTEPSDDAQTSETATTNSDQADEEPDRDQRVRTDDDTPAPSEGETASDTERESRDSETHRSETDSEPVQSEGSVDIELSALTVGLAERATENNAVESVSDLVRAAVREYLASTLAGRTELPDASYGDVSLVGPGPILDALSSVVDAQPDVDDVDGLIRTSLGAFLGGERRTVEVRGLRPYVALLDAVVQNDATAVSTREEVVAFAVYQYLASDGGVVASEAD